MGWFDHLNAPSRLPGMRSMHMNVVMPYLGDSEKAMRSYLNHARSEGLKVFVQINPKLLAPPNPVLVRNFVKKYRNHPSVYGWFLVDEPTLHDRYQGVTPAVAKQLYRQIKGADPTRPVGIAFGSAEDPRPFLHAMDVLLYDDYSQTAGKPEFWGLLGWRARLRQRAAMAASLKGYMPILQAFGQDYKGKPQFHKRLPTSREMRYITYTAIQHDATGLFFWVRYRARKDWIDRVLTPLAKEIAPARAAIASGPITGASAVGRSVSSTLFRDPTSKRLYLLVVHHGAGTVKAQVNLHPQLNTVRASARHGVLDVSRGRLVDTFGPFAAHFYRLS